MTREENCRLSQGTLKNTRKSPAFFKQGIGAVDETRTRDLHLGKVALYQLSYYRKATIIITRKRRKSKPFTEKAGAGEETRTHTPKAPDPKSGASAIPPRPRALSFGCLEMRHLHIISHWGRKVKNKSPRRKNALRKILHGRSLPCTARYAIIFGQSRSDHFSPGGSRQLG